jgi:hypothetical protein
MVRFSEGEEEEREETVRGLVGDGGDVRLREEVVAAS